MLEEGIWKGRRVVIRPLMGMLNTSGMDGSLSGEEESVNWRTLRRRDLATIRSFLVWVFLVSC